MAEWLEPLKPFTLGLFFMWFFMKEWRKATKFRSFEIKEWR
jgi:hypothetical protein